MTTAIETRVAYRLDAALTDIVPIGIVPEGLRLDVHFEGEVTDGALAGARARGVDHLLLRRDGVGVIEVRETIRTPGAPAVAACVRGYVVPPIDLPELEQLLDPSFRWPDLGLPINGFAMVQSALPGHEWMNSQALEVWGEVNVGAGRLTATATERRR